MVGRLELTVDAAGGVVWRRGAHGLEVLLIHRPGYDDWTFPKGKSEPGDADIEHTALREVLEETGYRCVSGHEIARTEYIDRKGRPKRVTYWEMRAVEGTFVPNDEVDGTRWLGLAAAGARLSFDRDRAVLDAFAAWAIV